MANIHALLDDLNPINDRIDGLGTGFQGTIKIADTKTENGIYIPTEEGTYANAGGLEYDPTEGLTYFIRTDDGWTKNVTPINFTPTGVVEEGNTEAVSGGEVFEALSAKTDAVNQFLVETAVAPTTRVNQVDVTDEIEKKVLLKKLDQCFNAIKCFGLNQNEFILLSQFGYNPTGNVSMGFIVVTNERDMQDIEALPVAFYSEAVSDYSKPFTLKFAEQYSERCYFVTLDMSVFGSDSVNFNFRNSQQEGSYKTSGIKTSAITYLDKKDIWGTGFIMGNGGTNWQYPRSYYFHNAVKHIVVSSKENNLVSITAVSYSESSERLAVVIMCCNDDDPNNLNINTGRNGFAYLRINIPITDVGIKKYTSYVLSGTSTAEVTMVIDLDYLFANVPSITTSGFIIGIRGELAQFIVSPSSGGGGTFNSLSLIDGEDDFQGNFRFVSANGNWSLLAGNNMTKLTRIPNGTTSIDINMSLDGGNSNVMCLDKDMKMIEWAYDGGDGTINSLAYNPPAGAVFLLASTTTSPSSAKITAKGTFELTGEVNNYRSISEGLADKHSGIIFEVNGFFFKKSKNTLCTVNEYEPLDGKNISLIPTLEKDGDFIIPTGVLHTDGTTSYTGGTLCAVKNGVMYFYNARNCAIFKSEDGGVTFTTIVDKFSHPGVWDEDDVNAEGRSAIVVMDNGELLFPVRHRGEEIINPALSTRKERFYVLYRTTNGQTGLERCFAFSHEDTLRNWLPPTDPQHTWPNHSGGCMLGDFTHDTKDNLIVITEYGIGTSQYWSELGVPNNGRGISGKAWVSFDYGLTWKKMFDADRKKVGTAEDDNNWYYFTSTYAAKMRHMHGVDIDPYRNVVHLTNGDNEDYIWSIGIDELKTWYDTAPTVDPNNDHPVYDPSDTFPDWDAKLIVPSSGKSFYSFSSMRAQQMKFAPVAIGWVGAHDASREFSYILHDRSGDFVFEPVFQFEKREDYDTEQDFVNSWSGTDGFVQGITIHNGVIYFAHSQRDPRPSRIWATIDGINWKIIYEGDNGDINFAGKILLDGVNKYLSPGGGVESYDAGFWKLKIKS